MHFFHPVTYSPSPRKHVLMLYTRNIIYTIFTEWVLLFLSEQNQTHRVPNSWDLLYHNISFTFSENTNILSSPWLPVSSILTYHVSSKKNILPNLTIYKNKFTATNFVFIYWLSVQIYKYSRTTCNHPSQIKFKQWYKWKDRVQYVTIPCTHFNRK